MNFLDTLQGLFARVVVQAESDRRALDEALKRRHSLLHFVAGVATPSENDVGLFLEAMAAQRRDALEKRRSARQPGDRPAAQARGRPPRRIRKIAKKGRSK